MASIESRLARLQQIYHNSPLLKGSIWYTGGQFVLKVLAFLSIFIFTRLLTTDEYGTVALFTTWVMLLARITSLNLDAAAAQAFIDYAGRTFDDFIASILTLALISSTLAVGLFVVMPEIWLVRVFQLDHNLVVMAGVAAVFLTVYQINLRVWQMRDKPQLYVWTGLLLEVGVILLSILLILISYVKPDMSRILSYTFVYAAISIIVLKHRFKLVSVQINREYWLYGLTFAIPLMPHVIASIALNQLDRVMIDAYIGRSEAGIYSYAYQLGSITSMIWFAINTAWIPWFYRKLKAEDFAVIRLRTWQYQMAFTAMTILLLFAMPAIVRWISPLEYHDAIPIVPTIIATGFFQMLCSFPLAAETYHRRIFYVSSGTVLAGILNVGLNMVFIPQNGYIAAGWTTLVSYIFLFIVHMAFTHYGLKVRNIYSSLLMFILSFGIITITIGVALMYS